MDQPLRRIHIYESLGELSLACASSIASAINDTLKSNDKFSLVLSGGETPKSLYGILTNIYRDKIPWERVNIYWGDERYVPYDDPASNFRLATEMLLDKVNIPKENIHAMPTYYPEPIDGAIAYEKLLKLHFITTWPEFDLILLGLGADGHTASLFPNSLALSEISKWVTVSETDKEPKMRLTLTLPVINAAKKIYFIASGANKAEALKMAFSDKPNTISCPASGVRPTDGKTEWWIDKQAASLLQQLS